MTFLRSELRNEVARLQLELWFVDQNLNGQEDPWNHACTDSIYNGKQFMTATRRCKNLSFHDRQINIWLQFGLVHDRTIDNHYQTHSSILKKDHQLLHTCTSQQNSHPENFNLEEFFQRFHDINPTLLSYDHPALWNLKTQDRAWLQKPKCSWTLCKFYVLPLFWSMCVYFLKICTALKCIKKWKIEMLLDAGGHIGGYMQESSIRQF